VRFYFTGTEFLYDYKANLSKAVAAKRLPLTILWSTLYKPTPQSIKASRSWASSSRRRQKQEQTYSKPRGMAADLPRSSSGRGTSSTDTSVAAEIPSRSVKMVYSPYHSQQTTVVRRGSSLYARVPSDGTWSGTPTNKPMLGLVGSSDVYGCSGTGLDWLGT